MLVGVLRCSVLKKERDLLRSGCVLQAAGKFRTIQVLSKREGTEAEISMSQDELRSLKRPLWLLDDTL